MDAIIYPINISHCVNAFKTLGINLEVKGKELRLPKVIIYRSTDYKNNDYIMWYDIELRRETDELFAY